MKELISSLFLILSASLTGQTFTDIAAQQGVTSLHSAAVNFGSGMSFFDFNEDGWDDLTMPTDQDSIFMYRNVNGTFQKVEPALYAPGEVRQISWVDYDNNGDLDLFVSFWDIGIRLYENTGNFQFLDVTQAAGFNTSPFHAYGFSFADPDKDGDLDVYVCSYESIGFSLSYTPNRYYQNQGDGTFIDMAGALGINNGAQTSFMSVWFDVNNDELLDLHVINDRHSFPDALYLNSTTNQFSSQAVNYNIDNDGHWPMGVSVADFDNDGYQDVFKSNAANGTIWNGNPLNYKLFKNNAGTNFSEVAGLMNISPQSFAWGGLWVDYNNDSFEDLYVATGYIDTANNPSTSSLLFTNQQGASFTNTTDSVLANITKTSYCPVKGDINRDGFYDIAVLNQNAIPNILLNGSNNNNYIRITLEGTTSNRMAIGALIKVYANNTCQTQTVFCGSGLCAQDSQHKIFGIGNKNIVDSVVVLFPSGRRVMKQDLQANQEYLIREQIIAPLSLSLSNTNFCAGDTVILGVSGLNNYSWSDGDTTETVAVASNGSYSFTAESATGDSLFVSDTLTLSFHSDLLYQPVVSDITCGNPALGSVELIFANATSLSSVQWSNGGVGVFQDTLAAGNYAYTITSVHGCTQQGMLQISNTPMFTTQYLTTLATNPNGGSVEFFHWGGTPPFQYLLNGDSVESLINNLTPGLYEIEIIDALGCLDTVQFEITETNTNSLQLTQTQTLTIKYKNNYIEVCSGLNEQIDLVQVSNVMGKVLAKWDQNLTSCEKLPIRLQPGFYNILVLYNGQKSSLMLVVNQ